MRSCLSWVSAASSRRGAGAAAVAVVTASLAVGCASPLMPSGEAPPPSSAAASSELYQVGASDRLVVRVLPDPAIERIVIVRPDGLFSMDLIGDVQAAGRTTNEIAADVQTRMEEYRQSPSVSVVLESPLSNAVAVMGEVETPVLFPLERDTRLSEAVARAGGATELAAASRVRVVRKTAEGETLFIANLDNIQGGQTATDMLLQRGDLVFVPPAMTVEAGYALRRFLYPLEQVMRTIAGPLLGFLIR